jgi:hypothetical protein
MKVRREIQRIVICEGVAEVGRLFDCSIVRLLKIVSLKFSFFVINFILED